MTAQDIITDFELQVDDNTELSTQQELDLLNKVYKSICADRPWEFLKKGVTGTVSYDSGLGLYYISLPADFMFFAGNASYTDNTREYSGTAQPFVVFTGSAFTPCQIVNFSDRNQYLPKNGGAGNSGFAYLDMANNRIVFTGLVQDISLYSFDYIYEPADLELGDTPVFPARFHKIFAPMMSVDNDILQIQDRSASYINENTAKGTKILNDMYYWNASLIMN